MKLLKLTLTNFKGIKNFTLETNGGNVAIYGDNATGKTTIYDAFLWLLFDKDSRNKKDFAIKTLDIVGNEVHNLNHEVEAVFELNGRKLSLKKVLTEKWTKKRGSVSPEFSGHTTEYFINEVPAKQSEYKKQVASIIDEDAFRLLTNPAHFNENITWQQRRTILLQICGDIEDAEVIASNATLAELQDILCDRTLEEHRKMIAAKRAAINKRLDEIPARIDEAHRALPDLTDMDKTNIQGLINNLESELNQKQEELARLNAGGQIADLNRQKAEIETDMTSIERSIRGEVDEQIQAKQKELFSLQNEAAKGKAAIATVHAKITEGKRLIASINSDIQKLGAKWQEVSSRQLSYEANEICLSCGQMIPAEQVEEAYRKVLANFNGIKAKDLADIDAEGKKLKAMKEQAAKQLEALELELENSKAQLEGFTQAVSELEQFISSLREAAPDYTQDSRYLAAVELRESIIKQIALVKENQTEAASQICTSIEEAKAMISFRQADIAQFAVAEAGQKRINELQEEQQKLGQEFEDLEHQLFLTDEFIRSKVSMLEDKINARFKLARFKMFDTQINGGIAECCETTYRGVPYSSMNKAAMINTGLDIIATLADYYGFYPPIFVDNKEAVTKLYETKQQMISLIVSEPDKALRVETESQKDKEVA